MSYAKSAINFRRNRALGNDNGAVCIPTEIIRAIGTKPAINNRDRMEEDKDREARPTLHMRRDILNRCAKKKGPQRNRLLYPGTHERPLFPRNITRYVARGQLMLSIISTGGTSSRRNTGCRELPGDLFVFFIIAACLLAIN